MRGLFIREIPVQLVNLSLSGCLLRAQYSVPCGATGELQIELGGTEYHDAIYVTRLVTRSGTSFAHDLGGEFLWVNRRPSSPSQGTTRSIVPH